MYSSSTNASRPAIFEAVTQGQNYVTSDLPARANQPRMPEFRMRQKPTEGRSHLVFVKSNRWRMLRQTSHHAQQHGQIPNLYSLDSY